MGTLCHPISFHSSFIIIASIENRVRIYTIITNYFLSLNHFQHISSICFFICRCSQCVRVGPFSLISRVLNLSGENFGLKLFQTKNISPFPFSFCSVLYPCIYHLILPNKIKIAVCSSSFNSSKRFKIHEIYKKLILYMYVFKEND